MKSSFITWVVALNALPCAVGGQNLVENSSFEDFANCPDSPGQGDFAVGWEKFRWTPDYFNVCNINDYCDVPSNAFGYQQPATGVAYVGVVTFDGGTPEFREYLGAELLQPLVPNMPVNISFRTSPGGWGWYTAQRFQYTSDRIGIFFTMQPWSGTTGPIPNSAALFLNYPLTDTLNWTTVAGTYVPDSAYAYIVIGNFFSDTLTTVATQDQGASYPGAYAFVDDICVSYGNDDCLTSSGLQPIITKELIVSPNPFTEALCIHIPEADRSIAQVLDINGRVVWSGALDPLASIRLETTTWPVGHLVLHVTRSNGRMTSHHLVHFPTKP